MAKESPPFRVNSWFNSVTEDRGEVWWNGRDGYTLHVNGNLVGTWNVYFVPEWGETHANLIAVGEACRVGYKTVMKRDFPGKEEPNEIL